MNRLFIRKDGKVFITDEVKSIWLLNEIIETYGNQTACKIFEVFHFMVDLSLSNPFKDLSETDKLEKIISAVAPETSLNVDWNSFVILDAIEIVRDLYSSQAYRYYLVKKDLLDRAIETVKYVQLNATKEFGNADQIKKWDLYIQEAFKSSKEAYKAFLEEQGAITVRGAGQQNIDNISGKEKELE